MADKIKTITVTAGWGDGTAAGVGRAYRIERVTDSTEFTPLAFLSKAQVDELCAAKQWKVTILPVTK